MKKVIFIFVVTMFIFSLALELGLFEALFMLFLLGVIPGTQFVVPANVMLLMICTAICVVLFYSIGRDILRAIFDYYLPRSQSPEIPASKRHLRRI